MKSKTYKFIIIFITVTVLATVALQVFWNLKNYNENKIQLIKEVQVAFDNSVEHYYFEDSKNDFVAIVGNDKSLSPSEFIDNLKLDTVFNKQLKSNKTVEKDTNTATAELESIEFSEESANEKEKKIIKKTPDQVIEFKKIILPSPKEVSSVQIFKGKRASDSISKLKNLVNKIVISMVKDSIEFTKLAKAVDREIARKNINVRYSIQHFKADTVYKQFSMHEKEVFPLTVFSASTYLPKNQKLQISFSDPTVLLLQRSLTEIILSLMLSLSVVFCLLYLLRIIQTQKSNDEIKNDLISNITHEFKTPITTIATAIEGIKNFNTTDDKEKTNRYLEISGQQLDKLKIMVEKLLETASLNTDKLNLSKQEINLVELLKNTIEKHQIISDKNIFFDDNQGVIMAKVDVFHFENVLSNLIDNAIKYGGNTVQVAVIKKNNQIEITVEDDGAGIEKTHREKIFEQFYRVPKGNIHDVKGFGIGLYYAKKIIEKHHGMLSLLPISTKTIFKITLSNV